MIKAMRMVPVALALLAAPACTRVDVGQHVAAQDYEGSPKRMLVINRLDRAFAASFPDDFAAALVPALERCGIAGLVYQPDALALDNEAKFEQARLRFKPDTVLTITQTQRYTYDGDVRSGTYLLRLYDLDRKRDLWRSVMGAGASMRLLVSRSTVGASFADAVVRALTADRIIKTCPPAPKSPA